MGKTSVQLEGHPSHADYAGIGAVCKVWIARLRLAGVGVLAGLLAGLAAGIVARIDMRVVAVTAGMRPVFTVGGSLVPVLIGAIVGAPFGMIFALVRPHMPGPRPGWWVKGLVFGLLLFLILELPLYLWQPDFRSELALAPGHLGIALFGVLPLIFGVLVGQAARRLDGRLPANLEPGSETLAGFFALLILGLVGTGLVVYGIVLAFIEAGR